ncbi:MAG TPA: penicillin-binding transpeptidase domain-containing protein [Candidatus Baltobacteraceae bacterium]|nr:penicillin-binding transpeptidase domain-containing protein [Candidatus Baltobacteraceae bacterium]
MNNRTVWRLGTLFTILFAMLAVRQAYVQIVQAPVIAANPYNPRHALLAAGRGRILASDGTVLAETINGKRFYPLGPALSHTVGYVSRQYGTSGLEDAYDRALTPAASTGDIGAQLGEIVLALHGKSEISRGADLVTTIRPAIETTLYNVLSRYARGAGVVMDPRSGEVLALASVPGFDPNVLSATFPSLRSDSSSPLLDRALDGLYPPGSTFKIVTASAALDSGAVSMNSTFYDPGYYTIGNFTLHDDEGEATGTQDLTGAFALSSNVDFGQIALKMGTATFYRYVARWGIGEGVEFQLPVSTDRVPSESTVTPGELAQMGFGQGALLVTPLRMALVTSTIAGNGVEPRPYIVREVRAPGTVTSTYEPGELAAPITADTSTNVKNMMIAVVQRGTGRPAALPGVAVAGKTGTATNPSGAPHSWFVCFAPAQNPRIVVAIVLENSGYGAQAAAPAAREVLEVALKLTNTAASGGT